MALRRNRRGHASFAWVAVALLLLGSGAALFSHAVPAQDREERQRLAAEDSAIELSRKAEMEVVRAIALDTLEQGVAQGRWSAQGLSVLSRNIEDELGERLNATYPRRNSLGHWIFVELRFVRVVPVPAWAEAAGPGGVRSMMELPVFARVEGGADVEVRLPSGRAVTQFAGLGATAWAPALLPIALAGAVGVEATYGGRVERFVGQAAEAALHTGAEAHFDAQAARAIVVLGLQLEMAAQFLSAGNASLDAALLSHARAGRGVLATDFFPSARADFFEAFPAPAAGQAVSIEAPIAAAGFAVVNFSDAELGVYPSWALFDGQELGAGTWGALTIEAWGTVSFGVRVQAEGRSVEVGPIEVPVAIRARAAKSNLTPALCVDEHALAAALGGINRAYGGSPFRDKLFEAGLRPDGNGSFEVNDSVVAVITQALATQNRVALPPVEDVGRFFAAYAAPRERRADLQVQLLAPANVNGSRAVLTVDGVPSRGAVVAAGRAQFPDVPAGMHNLSVAVEVGHARFVGGGLVLVGEASSNAAITLETSPDLSFLRDALRRAASEGSAEVAGVSLLQSAAALAGTNVPISWNHSAKMQAFSAQVLTRLAVLLEMDVLSAPERLRAEQAQAMLKVVVALLGAADSVRHERSGTNQSFGGLAGAVGVLAFRPDPVALIDVSLAATKLATASIEEGGLVVRFFHDGKAAVQVVYRLDQLTLVAGALGGALSLASDFVVVHQEFKEADGGGLALAVAKVHVHLADLTVDVAKGVYALAGAVTPALKVAFKVAGLVVGAAMLVVEVALVYHEYHGNWSAIGQSLVRPAELAGLLTLPGIAGSAIATVGGLVALAGGSSLEFGPIGLAAGLVVLAALLVINKEAVASAIFGTLPLEAARNISRELARVAGAAFETGLAAISFDVREVLGATRASAARAGGQWVESSITTDQVTEGRGHLASMVWMDHARALGLLSSGILALRFASSSAIEQLDDFASGHFVDDPGRETEGYAFIRDAAGREYPFEGHVRVGQILPTGFVELTRDEWRMALDGARSVPAAALSVSYDLTDSNSIPLLEFSKWADKFAACAQTLRQALGQVDEAERQVATGPAN